MKISLLTIVFTLITISCFSQLGWVQVPSLSPGSSQNTIRGISGTSSSDVWAVGYFSNTDPNLEVFRDLIIHWNGNSWQQFPPLNLSTTLNDLKDVEAISANDVWAVGDYHDITARSMLIHYDGTSWTNQPLPLITGGSYLKAIHAVSPTDIWAVGRRAGVITGYPPYVIRYNGSSWTEINVPGPQFISEFNDINGTANDLWAVGYKANIFGQFHSLAMHWDGSNWTEVSLPSSVVTPQTVIESVKRISTNDVWAIGTFLGGGMFTIHWNGTAWAVVSSTSGAPVIGADLAAVSANNVSAVATEISHWDGTAWTTVDALSQHTDPILRSTVVFSNGEIWAGGHAIDLAANKYVTLVYRSVNHTPLFAGGTAQTWNVGTNSNNNSPGNLLLTTDPDVRQILTYSIVTAPAHGTLGGLPTTAITNNGSALPTGIGYTPQPGYIGTDQFVIRVAAGPVNSQTTINVNVLGALPVTLIEFKAAQSANSIILNWKAESENNLQKYIVERSGDGRTFGALGEVAARNTSGVILYSFKDAAPLADNNNYYRLRMVDKDGSVKYSSIVNVRTGGAVKGITVFPNPVTGSVVNVQLQNMQAGAYTVRLYNLQGQAAFTKQMNHPGGSATEILYLPQTLAKGMYQLEIANTSSYRKTVKMIIQ